MPNAFGDFDYLGLIILPEFLVGGQLMKEVKRNWPAFSMLGLPGELSYLCLC